MSVKYKIRDQQGLHFFTCTICGWVDLFSRTVFRDVILDSWRYCQEHKGLQIWGYVFMTNHIHFIASAKAPHKLEDILRDFKKHTAKKILELLNDTKSMLGIFLLGLKRFFFCHFSPFFSHVIPTMLLQKRKN